MIPGRGRRRLAGAVLALAVGGLCAALAGCGPPAAKPRDRAVLTRPTYETISRDNAAAIALGERMVSGPLRSASAPIELIGLYNERARLTGNYADYGRAEDLLARLQPAFGQTDSVCLTTAKLHYTLHRLARAKAALDACPRLAGTVEDLGLRADIAFHTGRYKDAGIIYRALVNQVGTTPTYIQLALYLAKTGSPGEALAMMEAAERRYHGGSALMQSWFALQRGLIEMDRGRYDEARALFAIADERLPGYWLNTEHLAEIAALRGDKPAAKRLYEAVVKQTAAPEYLDALGAMEAEAGRAGAARTLFSRAEAIYTERARRFPEAIAGHALDHYLDAAPQPAKALVLAEANFRNRPQGDSANALARAYLLNGRPADARRLLEDQLAKGWDTAETWWTLSLAAKAAGGAARAASAANEARRRNPHSETQYGL